MKTQKESPNKDLIIKLRSVLGNDVYDSMMTSFGSMADILCRYLMGEAPDFNINHPSQVLYALVQCSNYFSILSMAFHNPEKLKEKLEVLYFPNYNITKDLDAEARLIFIVKGLYEQLKESGKIL